MGFLPDGRTLACLNESTVEIRDFGTGSVLKTLRGHRQQVQNVAVCPAGRVLASVSSDRVIKLWDIYTGREIMSLQNEGLLVRFTPDGKTLVTWGDLPSGEAKLLLRPPPSR
jgi:WD40 repeat protein